MEFELTPVRKHLAELERAEYAYGHGADPIRREHMLPRAADTAYDQARRMSKRGWRGAGSEWLETSSEE